MSFRYICMLRIKKIKVLQLFCIQAHTKVFWSYGENDSSLLYRTYIALNIMKLIYVIYIYMKMFSIKNGIKTTSILHTESHKSFPILCGNFSKRILSYLCYVNYNEINIHHSDIEKHVSHEKWLK